MEFSYDPQLIADCSVIWPKHISAFSDSLLAYALQDCRLQFQKLGEVYIIQSYEGSLHFKGKLLDASTGQPIPQAIVQSDQGHAITDANGEFEIPSTIRKVLLQIRHLAYQPLDTSVSFLEAQKIVLQSKIIELKEVVVDGADRKRMAKTNERGEYSVTINNKELNLTPAQSDDPIVGILRAQSGVLASGERTYDMHIRGSYVGHSQMYLEGIPLYQFQTENIGLGIVSPLVIGKADFLSHFYGTRYGDRLGGRIQLYHAIPPPDSIQLKMRITEQSVSSSIDLPFHKRWKTQLAGRYQFRNPGLEDLNQRFPFLDHDFYDIHLNMFGHLIEEDDIKLILNRSEIRFNQLPENLVLSNNYIPVTTEGRNAYTGGSLQFQSTVNEDWNLQTHVQFAKLDQAFAYTAFEEDFDPQNDVEFLFDQNLLFEEVKGEIIISQPSTQKHSLRLGGDLSFQSSEMFEAVNGELSRSQLQKLGKLGVFLEDNWKVTDAFIWNGSGRADVLMNAAFVIPQFRSTLSYAPNSNWTFTHHTGTYAQTQAPIDLYAGPFTLLRFWALASGYDTAQVQQSWLNSVRADVRWNQQHLGIELFHRNLTGITSLDPIDPDVFPSYRSGGTGRSWGLQLEYDKQWRDFHLWTNYNYSFNQVRFEASLGEDGWFRAPHDQRYEWKAGLEFNKNSFSVSAQFVYGSGFPFYQGGTDETGPDYARLDTHLSYRFSLGKTPTIAGLNVLNILNRDNLMLARNLEVDLNDEPQGSLGLPLTFSVFLQFDLNLGTFHP